MTGRELIVYILQNNLEDTEMFNDELLGLFLTPMAIAKKFDVGTETVYLWYRLGQLSGVKIGNGIYFPINAVDPRQKVAKDNEQWT